MSIASELNRLLQAKSDLATSIAAKGVTVPAATTIDGYAALVDSISGGGTNILNEMENMHSVIPYSKAYDASYAFPFNFVPGKTYRVIVKPRHTFTAGNAELYCYEGNANSPNRFIGRLMAGDTIGDFTYTHDRETTYSRCGIWVTASGERNVNHACAVYIKEI